MLQHTSSRCNTLGILQHTTTHYKTLPNTATHCNIPGDEAGQLQHAPPADAKHCNMLQHITTHYNTLQHTATHYIKLQHTATHCNTLQHTATHCNTPAGEAGQSQHASPAEAKHCLPLHTQLHGNTSTGFDLLKGGGWREGGRTLRACEREKERERFQ